MKTTTQFTAFKTNALKNEPLIKVVNLADITIVSDKMIRVGGTDIRCSENAINNFASIVGMPKAFSNSLTGAFGKEAAQKVADLQKAAKVIAGKNPQVTLVANRNFGIIESIQNGTSILPYDIYFDVFERMMNTGNLEITDFGHSDRGSVFISTVSRENEFHVGNMKDEVFHPGFSFTNDAKNGASVDSFINRLVCTNGMVGRGFGESFNYNPESMSEFFDRIKVLKTNGFLPGEFKAKVASAIHTKASFAEVKHAADMLTNSSKLTKEFVDRFVPYNDIRRKFLKKGADTTNWNAQQAQNAITDVSVWDVINGVTDFASHDYDFGVSSDNKLKLQVEAGKLLSRKSFDTQNLVSISL